MDALLGFEGMADKNRLRNVCVPLTHIEPADLAALVRKLAVNLVDPSIQQRQHAQFDPMKPIDFLPCAVAL
jgi:hypothetical protein